MLKLQNLSKYYSRNGTVALGLRKVNLTLGAGEFVAVVGESGSGKSTLLHVLSGLDTYEDGEMFIHGEETSHYTAEDWEQYRRQYVGFVAQSYNVIDSYTVLQNVEAALLISGYDPARRRQRALQIIERVGLTPFLHTKASKVSGGQMQRIVIARALAKDCPMIAADEPTGNLDSETSRQIIALLEEISTEKLVIVVTHNFAEVAHLATRKITIHDGEVVEDRQLKPERPVRPLPVLAAGESRRAWRPAMITAWRNVTSTPMKTLLMFLVMLLLTFGANFVYGSMINFRAETEFANTSPFFRNSTDQRIILRRSDNGLLAEDELAALAATARVKAVVRGDLALDQSVLVYYPKTYGGQVDVSARVVPHVLADPAKLAAGRLAAAPGEVLVNTRLLRQGVSAADLLGKSFEYTFKGLKLPLTVTGISEDADLGETLFVHPNVLDQIAAAALDQVQIYTYSVGAFAEIPFKPHVYKGTAKLQENEIALTPALAYAYCAVRQLPAVSCLEQIVGQTKQVTVSSRYTKHSAEYVIAALAAEEGTAPERGALPPIYVSQATYDKWASRPGVYQVSVMTASAADARALLPRLAERGYTAIYPYDTVDGISYLLRVLQWLLYGILMVIFIGIFFFITYFIMRTVMRSKRKDYVTMRSIGASQQFVRQVVFTELFVISTLTYLAALSLFGLGRVAAVPYVSRVLDQLFRAYAPLDYLYSYAIMLALVVLLTRRFHRQMFGESVVTALKPEEGE